MKQKQTDYPPVDYQDIPVIDFLNSLDPYREYSFLEVGSGTCRFVKKIKKMFPNIRITCVEINPNLARIAIEEGFEVYNSNILETEINKTFDIVHCSHVIEHFSYPQVTMLLDKIVEWTKTNGHFVIISPLMWKHFYDDIDHVRPYPPAAVLNYFHYEQQQKKSGAGISIQRIWYRTSPKQIRLFATDSIVYAIKPIRKFSNGFVIPYLNNLYEKLWKRYQWPSSTPNGYVMIVKLIGK